MTKMCRCMYIKVSHEVWNNLSGATLIAQHKLTRDVICYVNTLPEEYEKVVELPDGFDQKCVDGKKFGNILTILQIEEIQSLLEELGEEAKDAQTLTELRLMKKIKDILTNL